MSLTMDDIVSTLAPIHEAIAKVNDRELTSAGKTLRDFTETAQKSIQLASESQLGTEDQDEIIRLRKRLATLDTYQHALENFVKELKPRIQAMWEMGGVRSWIVQDRCRDAIEAIDGLLARNNLSSTGAGIQPAPSPVA